MNDTTNKLAEERIRYEAWADESGWRADNIFNFGWRAWIAAKRDATPSADQATQPAEAVAWCELTPSGKIAYFDGKPMFMVGPVGNNCHRTPLYTHPAPASASEPEVEGVFLAANDYADQRVMATKGRAGPVEVDAAADHLREVITAFGQLKGQQASDRVRASASVAGAGEALSDEQIDALIPGPRVGGFLCSMVSLPHAREAVRAALAARPVADGEAELPPLPAGCYAAGFGSYTVVFTESDMQAYARAALARQAPPAYQGTSERWRTIDIHARQAPAPQPEIPMDARAAFAALPDGLAPAPLSQAVQRCDRQDALYAKARAEFPDIFLGNDCLAKTPELWFFAGVEWAATQPGSFEDGLRIGGSIAGCYDPQPQAVTEDARDGERDTERLDWLLPNVHPATFGMNFEWDTDAEYLAGWRRVIDQEIREGAEREAARRAQTSSGKGE